MDNLLKLKTSNTYKLSDTLLYKQAALIPLYHGVIDNPLC